MGRKRFLIILIALCFFLAGNSTYSYAAPTQSTEDSERDDEDAEIEDEEEASGNKSTRFWSNIIGKVEDYFLGPDTEEGEIEDIKELDPYDMLNKISFGNDKGMGELKCTSSSFYQLIQAISALGMILSFVSSGIVIAWNRRRKSEELDAIASKILVFAMIFTIAELYGILVPLLKFLMK